MRTAAPRRAALFFLALAALSLAACSRDLDLPDLESSPPRIDTVAIVGLEPQAVVSSLPVLGGELVAIHGGGFPSDVAEVEVRIGSEDAEVLDTRFDRIVARVPALGTYGRVDLQVRTAIGFRSQAGAFRYDGPGQPSGFGSSDLDTSVDLGFVAPVQPPGAYGFSDLAVATGASDAALLVVPAVGLAVATVPLGLVPSSAAAWIDSGWSQVIGTIAPRLNVLAVTRGGAAALGTAFLSGSSVEARAAVKPLAPLLGSPSPCSLSQVVSTYYGTPVATWSEVGLFADQHKLATVDRARAQDRGEFAAVETYPDVPAIHDLTGPVDGWGPWGASSIILASRSEIWAYDTAAPQIPPKVLKVQKNGIGPAVPVTTLLTPLVSPACGASIERIYTLATASTPTGEAIAVAYRAGGVDRVALVDLRPGPSAGTVRSGIAGIIPTSVTLVPDPPFAAPTAWQVLAAGGTSVFRFRPVEVAPECGDLVADTALTLSATPGYLGGFGGMTTVVNGTRVLSLTPDGDLVTVLPPSLTSAGSIVRFASYGGVSIQQATIGETSLPVAIAEHAATDSSASDLDTGSALLVVSLAADRGSVALGGSGYGRGAVWLDVPAGGALAYTGDVRASGADLFQRGGAASVTHFAGGQCEGETVRIGASRPVTNGPDLVMQGPARSGALGPEGVARFGPAARPVYTVKDGWLYAYDPAAAKLDCLAGTAQTNPDWDPEQLGTCAPDAEIELGVAPLDVTLSAGDRAAAIRFLGTCPPVGLNICLPGDEVCQRAQCPPASQLVIVRPDPDLATSLVVDLPAPPASVAADRGGGFLVTMRCEEANARGECFLSDTLCDEYGTVPDEENGALVLVAEDGSAKECLAVQGALAGPVAVTPNGAEAWVTGTTPQGQFLVRLGLTRRTSDGAIDATRPAILLSSERLYAPPPGSSAPPGGVAFTPDGATGIVTVPGQYRVLLRE